MSKKDEDYPVQSVTEDGEPLREDRKALSSEAANAPVTETAKVPYKSPAEVARERKGGTAPTYEEIAAVEQEMGRSARSKTEGS